MTPDENAETMDQMRALIEELRRRNAELVEQRDELRNAARVAYHWIHDRREPAEMVDAMLLIGVALDKCL